MAIDEEITLTVQIDLSNADDERADYEIRQLRNELIDLGVDSVEFQTAESIPQGVKAIDAATLGVLLIAVAPIIVTKVLEFFHAWAMRREGRSIKIKVQNIKGASVEIEIPATMPIGEMQKWIDMVKAGLLEKPEKK